MSVHQIIYTSCRRGINGVNDGQQVFSYDAAFKDANNDEVKSLFAYQPPALELGTIMTEELALTMPKAFIYRKLQDNRCALARGTYLGRDYMGPAGRFGNHLSHVVVADEGDFQNYPCEFYGSGLLRERMEFEEVNNPNKPDFLPTPVLERGFRVDPDAVIEFLGEDNRMDIFKNMLHAVFAFESERKRVVICDDPENIIMWIAAVGYALPLKTALGINFSTYDFDPSLSASQICGVVPNGTRFTPDSSRYHFVFDFYQNQYPEFEKDSHYFDFVDVAMSFSYDSMQDFHRFLVQGYDYYKADEQMYAAYRLYSMLSDGVSGITTEELKSVLDFANAHGLSGEKERIIKTLLSSQGELQSLDIPAFKMIMDFIASGSKSMGQGDLAVIKGVMVDKVLYEFLNNPQGEKEFVGFYNGVDPMCKRFGFSISTELMRKENRQKIFAVMNHDVDSWKVAFIVHVVSSFVKDQHLGVQDLALDAPMGQLYQGLVKAVYSRNTENGRYMVTRILDEFSNDCKYLVNMALNMEGVLLDLPNGKEQTENMWNYFEQTMRNCQRDNFAVAYGIFGSDRRYEQVYMLYQLEMRMASGDEGRERVFNSHFRTYVNRDVQYAKQYKALILDEYYKSVSHSNSEAAYNARASLFDMICKENLDAPFGEQLVRELIKPIPFESPTRENGKIIHNAFDYLYNTLRKPVTGKLQLLVVGMKLEKCNRNGELRDALNQLARLVRDEKANLTRMTERALESYFDWLLPICCPICQHPDDLIGIYDLFDMTSRYAEIFFDYCAKYYLKQSKRDFDEFAMFLGFVFKCGTSAVRENVGKMLKKLNKQKMGDLEDQVHRLYGGDRAALRDWDEIKETATAGNSFLEGITGLFKKKNNS